MCLCASTIYLFERLYVGEWPRERGQTWPVGPARNYWISWTAAGHMMPYACLARIGCLPPQQIAAPRERNDRGKSGRDVKHIFTVGLCKRVLQRKHETSETQYLFACTVEVETWDRTTHPRQPQASDVCRAMCHSCFCAHTSGRETIVTQRVRS